MFIDISGAKVATGEHGQYATLNIIAPVDGRRAFASLQTGNETMLSFVAEVLAPTPTPANEFVIAHPVRIEVADDFLAFEKVTVEKKNGSGTKTVINAKIQGECEIRIVGPAQGLGPTGWVDARPKS